MPAFKHVDETERRLVKGMAKEGIPWTTIQKVTGRSSDTLNNILHSTPKRKGAPIQFTSKDAEKVFGVAEKMIKTANAQKEVPMEAILEESGLRDLQQDFAEEVPRDACLLLQT